MPAILFTLSHGQLEHGTYVIWQLRKQGQLTFIKNIYIHCHRLNRVHKCATCSELPSSLTSMNQSFPRDKPFSLSFFFCLFILMHFSFSFDSLQFVLEQTRGEIFLSIFSRMNYLLFTSMHILCQSKVVSLFTLFVG